MKKTTFLPLILLLVAALPGFSFGQYARVKFFNTDNQPFILEANGQRLYAQPATSVTVRVNQGNTYYWKLYVPGQAEPIAEKKVGITNDMLSMDFLVKENNKGEYVLRVKGAQREAAPAPAQNGGGGGGLKVETTYSESYSGPDGAYSKEEKTSTTVGNNGVSSTKSKSEATIDEGGFRASSETTQRGADPAAIGNVLGGKRKGKNTEEVDGRDLVIEAISYADGSTGGAAVAETTNAAGGGKVSAPAVATAPAGPAQAKTLSSMEGVSEVMSHKGLEFYFVATPAREYKVLFEVEANGLSTSMVTDKEKGFLHILDAMAEDVETQLRKKRNEGMRPDAIISVDGYTGQVVEFTNEGNDQLAEVQSYFGKEMYVVSKPKRGYETVMTYENTSPILGKPNVQGRMERTLKKIEKEHPDVQFDAIVTENGRQFDCIRFTD